jgi:hypothetical protein
VNEPEFVLLDEPAPAPGHTEVRPLQRAGPRGARQSVLVRIGGHPHRRRTITLVLLVVLGAGVAAGVLAYKRKQAAKDAEVEAETDLLGDVAIREPLAVV